ncbi:MAG: GNAT family N-acetyltransferase [Eubacteriales bacterium]|nr:GNAT family N-acetyltransferase [Eubacteriales bacterium]
MANRIGEIPVTNKLENYDTVKALYDRAFPVSEKFPYWIIRLMSLRKGFEYTAYFDDGLFCGLSYVISNDSDAFILYLAVNDKIRSKGYGTAILENIKEKHPGKQIVLNVEPLDNHADNQVQRQKRIKFYENNNFSVTGYGMETGGDRYWIMSNKLDFDKARFRKVIARLSFGFAIPKIEKI